MASTHGYVHEPSLTVAVSSKFTAVGSVQPADEGHAWLMCKRNSTSCDSGLYLWASLHAGVAEQRGMTIPRQTGLDSSTIHRQPWHLCHSWGPLGACNLPAVQRWQARYGRLSEDRVDIFPGSDSVREKKKTVTPPVGFKAHAVQLAQGTPLSTRVSATM